MPADRSAATPILEPGAALALLTYLREPHTRMEAAAELDLPHDAIRATLDALHLRHVPGPVRGAVIAEVEDRPGGVHVVRSDLEGMPDTAPLTELEGLLLLLALETMEGEPLMYDPAVVASAAAKVRDLIPGDIVLHVPAPPEPIDPGVRDAVRDALDRGVALRIRYRDGSDHVTEREIEPVKASSRDRRTYVHATEPTAAEGDGAEPVVKSFRIDRILAAEVVERRVRRPRGFDFDADDPHGLRDAETWIRVEIAEGAGWIRNYDPILEDDDGTLWLPADNRERALEILLRQHPDLRAVEPDDIRDVARRARAGLGKYARLPAPDSAENTPTTSEGD